MEFEPNQRVEVLGNCSEHPWLFSGRLYLLQVQPGMGWANLKGQKQSASVEKRLQVLLQAILILLV